MAFSGSQITRLHPFGWPTRLNGDFHLKGIAPPSLGPVEVHIWNLGVTERPIIHDHTEWDCLIGTRYGYTYLIRPGTSSVRRKTLRLSETARRRVTIDA